MQDPFQKNRLSEETSPYLRQHETNPVHWQPWEPDVLAEARANDKPILLSVGYAACHWCHVMAHESFEDDETAALMNAHFINIKIDREERPDLDALYQRALALIGGQGGWPLTMFLTPAGEPFWGGTYFPKEPQYGRPGFKQVLSELARIYHEDKSALQKNVGAIREALEKNASHEKTSTCPHDLLERAAQALLPHLDDVNGGLKGAPKFPQASALELFQDAFLKSGDPILNDLSERWLTSLIQGGIYDHVGGGFARYTVDERWLVPHFEKMLYDNAQILACLTKAWRQTKSPLFAERAHETIDWLLRDMVGSEGGFTSSYDADSEGEEGAYYVWQKEEIDALLADKAAAFEESYEVSSFGNWEGKNILNRLNVRDWQGEKEHQYKEQLKVLYNARSRRIAPGWDDKILTDWNGLMISALTDAAMTFEKTDWLKAAQQAFSFVTQHLSTENERLLHTYRAGKAHVAALAEDYANMALAALSLLSATGDNHYLAHAKRWVEVLQEDFWEEGGVAQSPKSASDVMVRTKPSQDSPVPAANSTLLHVYTKLFHLTGNAQYRSRAEDLIETFALGAMREPIGHATFITGFDRFLRTTELVLVGQRLDKRTKAFLTKIYQTPFLHPLVQVIEDPAALPSGHPASDKVAIEGQPTLYICREHSCSPPITDENEVSGNLNAP